MNEMFTLIHTLQNIQEYLGWLVFIAAIRAFIDFLDLAHWWDRND
jgi:hypothetical protein